MDVARQRNRFSGRHAGCLAAAVLGFFHGGIALGVVLASLMGPQGGVFGPAQGEWLPFSFFIGLPSSLIVYAIVGWWLGGRVADLRFRPTPGGAPAPKISKGWVYAGAVLGSIVGGAIGMGLTAVVARGVQAGAAWLMPILYFSPPVLCLVLGGFAALIFARRRAAQRIGK
jgi:hypothetical protein